MNRIRITSTPLHRRRFLGLAALSLPALAMPGCGGSTDDPAPARYRLTLRSHWTAAAFPTQFPAAAHLTGLVGATHRAGLAFWSPGKVASAGIQGVAETGSKTALLAEVAEAVAAGQAGVALSGDAATQSAPVVMLDFDVSAGFPAITFVSMLGPSPDWFTGVNGAMLLRDGQWIDTIDLPLRAYDAGTDEGATFASVNQATEPRGIVQPLSTAPSDSDFSNGVHRASGQSVASLSLQRLS